MKNGTVTRRDFIKLGTGAAATGLSGKVTILEPLRLAASAAAGSPFRHHSICHSRNRR